VLFKEERCFIIQLEKEIWKPIVGYEGLYEISNFGRVKSLPRMVKGKFDNLRFQKGSIRKIQVNNRGYNTIRLCKNGIYQQHFIHRLVANAFIPTKDNDLEINHKDENKQNNNVNNLEWVTRKENMNYGTVQSRIHKSYKSERLIHQRKVAQMNNKIRSNLERNNISHK